MKKMQIFAIALFLTISIDFYWKQNKGASTHVTEEASIDKFVYVLL